MKTVPYPTAISLLNFLAEDFVAVTSYPDAQEPFVYDPECPPGKIYFIHRKEWTRIQADKET